jgi:hypothetical protein
MGSLLFSMRQKKRIVNPEMNRKKLRVERDFDGILLKVIFEEEITLGCLVKSLKSWLL